MLHIVPNVIKEWVTLVCENKIWVMTLKQF